MRIQPITPICKPQVIRRDDHHIDWIPPPQEKALVDDITRAMDRVGWLGVVIAIGCICALVWHHISPWAVIGIAALGGAVWRLVKNHKEDL